MIFFVYCNTVTIILDHFSYRILPQPGCTMRSVKGINRKIVTIEQTVFSRYVVAAMMGVMMEDKNNNFSQACFVSPLTIVRFATVMFAPSDWWLAATSSVLKLFSFYPSISVKLVLIISLVSSSFASSASFSAFRRASLAFNTFPSRLKMVPRFAIKRDK